MMNVQQFSQAAEFRWGGLDEETLKKSKQMVRLQDGIELVFIEFYPKGKGWWAEGPRVDARIVVTNEQEEEEWDSCKDNPYHYKDRTEIERIKFKSLFDAAICKMRWIKLQDNHCHICECVDCQESASSLVSTLQEDVDDYIPT